jgi:hypothetical protein
VLHRLGHDLLVHVDSPVPHGAILPGLANHESICCARQPSCVFLAYAAARGRSEPTWFVPEKTIPGRTGARGSAPAGDPSAAGENNADLTATVQGQTMHLSKQDVPRPERRGVQRPSA